MKDGIYNRHLCFQDTDCLMLDEMSEDELVSSALNAFMGIADRKEDKVIRFPVDGKNGSTRYTLGFRVIRGYNGYNLLRRP